MPCPAQRPDSTPSCGTEHLSKVYGLNCDSQVVALDSRTGTSLLQYLRRCSSEQGQSIIMVTHDPKAAAYADRAPVLLDGRIVDDVPRPSAELMLATFGRLGA